MTEPEVIDVDISREVVVRQGEPAPPPAIFGSEDPNQIIATATARANALSRVIEDKKLYSMIQGRKHVTVEGWTLLGSLCGVFPVVEWTRPLPDGSGWEARVEARTLGGVVVGAAEAECTRGEKTWRTRDDYALRSMAQTRATSKAMRLPLSFVMTLAGFDATPAEEMPSDAAPRQEERRQPQPPRQQPPQERRIQAEVPPFMQELAEELKKRGATLSDVGRGLKLTEDQMNREGVLMAVAKVVDDGVAVWQLLDIVLAPAEEEPEVEEAPVEVV